MNGTRVKGNQAATFVIQLLKKRLAKLKAIADKLKRGQNVQSG